MRYFMIGVISEKNGGVQLSTISHKQSDMPTLKSLIVDFEEKNLIRPTILSICELSEEDYKTFFELK